MLLEIPCRRWRCIRAVGDVGQSLEIILEIRWIVGDFPTVLEIFRVCPRAHHLGCKLFNPTSSTFTALLKLSTSKHGEPSDKSPVMLRIRPDCPWQNQGQDPLHPALDEQDDFAYGLVVV